MVHRLSDNKYSSSPMRIVTTFSDSNQLLHQCAGILSLVCSSVHTTKLKSTFIHNAIIQHQSNDVYSLYCLNAALFHKIRQINLQAVNVKCRRIIARDVPIPLGLLGLRLNNSCTKLHYFVVQYLLVWAGRMFSSSFSGGFISLCSYAKLNYCNVSQYYVIVTATNSALSSTSKLNIFLRKINVAPSFTPAVYSGSVNEKCQSVSDLLLTAF